MKKMNIEMIKIIVFTFLSLVFLHFFLLYSIAKGDITGDNKISLEDAIYALQIVSGQRTQENWILYDDFESGIIDSERWKTGCKDGAIGEILVENGQLKISYHSDIGDTYCYAEAKTNQLIRKIKAVKVKITVESATEDSRGRIRGSTNTNDVGHYNSINLFGSSQKIECYTEKYSLENFATINHSNLQFKRPIDIMGNTFNVILWFLPDKSVFEVEGVGVITTTSYDDMSSDSIFPFVLDVKSTSGAGVATVYFDDVYVLYEE